MFKARCGLDVQELRVLRLVGDQPGVNFTRLAAMTRFERSATSRILSRLIKSGLIRRELVEDDARQFRLFITPKGNDLREVADPLSTALEDLILSSLSQTEREQFRQTLDKLSEWLAHNCQPADPLQKFGLHHKVHRPLRPLPPDAASRWPRNLIARATRALTAPAHPGHPLPIPVEWRRRKTFVDLDHMDNLVVTRSDEPGVAYLKLNRPEARNALSSHLMRALHNALLAAQADPAVRVIVLAGAGPAFCAGHDLREMRADPTRETHAALFAQCSQLMLLIQALRQPVIARVHGIATAAGCQLVATCDLAIATDTARFATPGVNIGLFCSTPMVALTRSIGRKAAMEMLLIGDSIDAAQALRLGLINQVVPEAALDEAVASMAAKIAAKSPLTLAVGKEAFYRQAEMPVADAYAYASGVMTSNMQTNDAAEGIDAFLTKRSPHWSGT
eukprot:gene5779-5842_t